MIILLFWLFPMTFLGIFLAIFIATRKNFLNEFLITLVFGIVGSILLLVFENNIKLGFSLVGILIIIYLVITARMNSNE